MHIRTSLAAAVPASVGVVGAAGTASSDSIAEGYAKGSPGVLAGNVVQVPSDLHANVCGNTISAIGPFNPAGGNTCVDT